MSSSEPIQIITPVEHRFELQLDSVKRILEADEIKDRNVVVVSVSGAFRKGKSFLLNFFLKYLCAQYKKHDVSDWLGEHGNSAVLNGFEFAGGRKPKTTGIWMWSEIFTHDFVNGEKLAIILLDTQGIFDSRSSMKDNTAIFAISMMLSSVQCYNVMQNIQEDDLQHLELFTEYGRLALNQSQAKAFQKLLFIVRDWPNADEFPYGDGQAFFNELMADSSDFTPEMKQLRTQIQSSFDKISAYLMPYPGNAVATGRNTNADLSQIDAEFIENLKKLVPLIFAPENLIPKKINGQNIRARDLVTFMQMYVDVFNGGQLPEPQTVMMAMASSILLVLCTDCLRTYVETMRTKMDEKSHNENEPYFPPLDFTVAHDEAKTKSLSQFQQKPKFGGQEIVQQFENKLIKEINEKFNDFGHENDEKQSTFRMRASAALHALEEECVKTYVDVLEKSLNRSNPLSKHDLQQIHQTKMTESISKFNNERKLGNNETIEMFRNKLEHEINLQYMRIDQQNDEAHRVIEEAKRKSEEEKARAIERARVEEMNRRIREEQANTKNLQLQTICLNKYKASMRNSLNRWEFDQWELEQEHQIRKQNSLSKFAREKDVNGTITNMLVSRLKSDIDESFYEFSAENKRKRAEIIAAEERERYERNMQELRRQLEENSRRRHENSSGCSMM